MNRTALFALLVLLAARAAAPTRAADGPGSADKPGAADKPAGRADADVKAIRGTWVQANGDRSWRWEFTDDDHLVEQTGARRVVTGRSAVKLDATKAPRHITWDGGVGIYELKGDALTVCFTAGKDDEKARPKAFAAVDGKHELLTFKRSK